MINIMKSPLLLTVLLALTSNSVSMAANEKSGGVTSGGGASIICFNQKNQIKSAELLDLYEGRNRFNYSITNQNTSATSQIVKAITKIQDPFYREKITEITYQIIDQVQFLPGQIVMPAPTDLGSEYLPILPAGCQIASVGFFENDGTLRISKTIYDLLKPTDKAALFLHEAVYFLLRQSSQESDSTHTRKIVAQLMSTGLSTEATNALSQYAYQSEFLYGNKFFIRLSQPDVEVNFNINYVYPQNSSVLTLFYTSANLYNLDQRLNNFDSKSASQYQLYLNLKYDRTTDILMTRFNSSNRTVLANMFLDANGSVLVNQQIKLSHDRFVLFFSRPIPSAIQIP